MSFGSSSNSDASIPAFKKFVSEDEIEEKRKKRQEEWEKVRKPDEPLEAPEEEVDNRCLFDKLQEQKQKKEDEFNEKTRLSNQVQGLDNDEADFLDFVSQKKEEINQKRQDEENEVLQEYRNTMVNQVTDLTAPSSTKPKTQTAAVSSTQNPKRSQQSLLIGAVKRKSEDGGSPIEKKQKSAADSSSSDPTKPSAASKQNIHQSDPLADGDEAVSSTTASTDRPQVAQVIGVLPGLGAYGDSSDSDDSSCSDSDIDLPRDIYHNKLAAYTQSHSH